VWPSFNEVLALAVVGVVLIAILTNLGVRAHRHRRSRRRSGRETTRMRRRA
jgi:hypothetical protein